MELISLVDTLTFIIITFWLFQRIHIAKQGSRFLVAILMYIFYVIPIGLDSFIMMADYSYSGWWGFIIPRRDFLTNFIYDVFLLYTEYIILFHKIKCNSTIHNAETKDIGRFKYILLLFAIVPPVAVILLIGQPGMLYTFQWRELDLFSTGGSYPTIERFTYIAVSCSVMILFLKSNKSNSLLKILSLMLLLTNICIQGKRAIMFFAVINIALVIYFRFKNNSLSRRKLLLYGGLSISAVAILAALMVSMTVAVKIGRGYDPSDTEKMYTTTRIDFLRDDRVRLAIYSELHPNEVEVLRYPMQTFVTDVFSFIPLNYVKAAFGIESYAYQTHFTYALEHKKNHGTLDVKNMSYMTVSFVPEVISNLGILGIIFIPFLCLRVARWSDKYPYPFNLLILSAFTLINLFDFTYVAVFIEIVAIICILYSRVNYKKNRTSIPVLSHSSE